MPVPRSSLEAERLSQRRSEATSRREQPTSSNTAERTTYSGAACSTAPGLPAADLPVRSLSAPNSESKLHSDADAALGAGGADRPHGAGDRGNAKGPGNDTSGSVRLAWDAPSTNPHALSKPAAALLKSSSLLSNSGSLPNAGRAQTDGWASLSCSIPLTPPQHSTWKSRPARRSSHARGAAGPMVARNSSDATRSRTRQSSAASTRHSGALAAAQAATAVAERASASNQAEASPPEASNDSSQDGAAAQRFQDTQASDKTNDGRSHSRAASSRKLDHPVMRHSSEAPAQLQGTMQGCSTPTHVGHRKASARAPCTGWSSVLDAAADRANAQFTSCDSSGGGADSDQRIIALAAARTRTSLHTGAAVTACQASTRSLTPTTHAAQIGPVWSPAELAHDPPVQALISAEIMTAIAWQSVRQHDGTGEGTPATDGLACVGQACSGSQPAGAANEQGGRARHPPHYAPESTQTIKCEQEGVQQGLGGEERSETAQAGVQSMCVPAAAASSTAEEDTIAAIGAAADEQSEEQDAAVSTQLEASDASGKHQRDRLLGQVRPCSRAHHVQISINNEYNNWGSCRD